MLSDYQEQEGLLCDYESLVGKLSRCRRKKSRKEMGRFRDGVVDSIRNVSSVLAFGEARSSLVVSAWTNCFLAVRLTHMLYMLVRAYDHKRSTERTQCIALILDSRGSYSVSVTDAVRRIRPSNFQHDYTSLSHVALFSCCSQSVGSIPRPPESQRSPSRIPTLALPNPKARPLESKRSPHAPIPL